MRIEAWGLRGLHIRGTKGQFKSRPGNRGILSQMPYNYSEETALKK
jgi:hypothetical protein